MKLYNFGVAFLAEVFTEEQLKNLQNMLCKTFRYISPVNIRSVEINREEVVAIKSLWGVDETSWRVDDNHVLSGPSRKFIILSQVQSGDTIMFQGWLGQPFVECKVECADDTKIILVRPYLDIANEAIIDKIEFGRTHGAMHRQCLVLSSGKNSQPFSQQSADNDRPKRHAW